MFMDTTRSDEATNDPRMAPSAGHRWVWAHRGQVMALPHRRRPRHGGRLLFRGARLPGP